MLCKTVGFRLTHRKVLLKLRFGLQNATPKHKITIGICGRIFSGLMLLKVYRLNEELHKNFQVVLSPSLMNRNNYVLVLPSTNTMSAFQPTYQSWIYRFSHEPRRISKGMSNKMMSEKIRVVGCCNPILIDQIMIILTDKITGHWHNC